MSDLRAKILEAQNLKSERVDVPEWGTTVYVSKMLLTDRLEWAAITYDDDGKLVDANFRGRLLTFALHDEQGNRIFKTEDARALEGSENEAVVIKLFNLAVDANGLGAKAVEQAEKN